MGIRIPELPELTDLQSSRNTYFEVVTGITGAEASKKVSWENLIRGINAQGIAATINPTFAPTNQDSQRIEDRWHLQVKLNAQPNASLASQDIVSALLTSINIQNINDTPGKANHYILGGGPYSDNGLNLDAAFGGGVGFITSGSRSRNYIMNNLAKELTSDKTIWSNWNGTALALNLVSDGFIQLFPAFQYSDGHKGWGCFEHGIRLSANGGLTGLKWETQEWKKLVPAPLYLPQGFRSDTFTTNKRLVVTHKDVAGYIQESLIEMHTGVPYTLPIVRTYRQSINFFATETDLDLMTYEDGQKITKKVHQAAGVRLISLNLSDYVKSGELVSIFATGGGGVPYQASVYDAAHRDRYIIKLQRPVPSESKPYDITITIISHNYHPTTGSNIYYPGLPLPT